MVITLLSDFGDVYPASMKGVILDIDPGANIVDITHSIPRHDIRAGAFILMNTAKYYPSGTVHIAVVDPGVGTKRRAIAVRAESGDGKIHFFIGPDNGLLIPAAQSIGKIKVYEISNRALFRENISATFHGRDIFAPIGAHISKGLGIEKVGGRINDFNVLHFGAGRKIKDSLQGEVIYIDIFGNIITNFSGKTVNFRPGDDLLIDNRKVIFSRSYGFCEEGEPLALIGSHGYLEIAVNMGSAAKMFCKKQGDKIKICIAK
ncbi:MAG: S-adenosyl-l-methionine hydroxide adenosyltransferase family protein [Candidatus Methanoperedens sp.]|nr:S-adenosyl-l-methionine hydroxide adenosyltransferase family protein [Candidatus Methanoperedens sp.]